MDSDRISQFYVGLQKVGTFRQTFIGLFTSAVAYDYLAVCRESQMDLARFSWVYVGLCRDILTASFRLSYSLVALDYVPIFRKRQMDSDRISQFYVGLQKVGTFRQTFIGLVTSAVSYDYLAVCRERQMDLARFSWVYVGLCRGILTASFRLSYSLLALDYLATY